MQKKQKLTDTREPISDAETYTMTSFMERVGWGRHALREARRKGLRVVLIGGKIFIRGCDFSAFLGTLAADCEVNR